MSIPQSQVIQSQLTVFAPFAAGLNDPVILSDYVTKVEIEGGNVFGIGDSGTDGVVPSLRFTLKSDVLNNFNPLIKYGKVKYIRDFITGDGGATYTPKYSNILQNTVRFFNTVGSSYQWQNVASTWASLTAEDWSHSPDSPTIIETTIVQNADGTITFGTNIPNDEIVGIQYSYIDVDPITGRNDWNWSNGVYQPLLWERRRIQFRAGHGESTYYKQSINGNDTNRYALDNTVVLRNTVRLFSITNDTYYTEDLTVDYDRNEVVLGVSIPSGVDFVIQYSYMNDETILIFDGYLGDDIQVDDDNQTVTCIARGLERELQNNVLQSDEIRNYDIETEADYINLEDWMQNNLDDKFDTFPYITVLVDDIAATGETGYFFPPAADLWENRNIHAIHNKQAANIGWLAGFKRDYTDDVFKYYITEPDKLNDAVEDIDLSWISDIKSQTLNINGLQVINKVKVEFYVKGNDSVTISSYTSGDQGSIDTYGLKYYVIPAELTGIDDVIKAQALGDSIIADFKDLLAETLVKMPLLLYYLDGLDKKSLWFYTKLKITNPLMFDTPQVLAIESYKHTFDYQSDTYTTEARGVFKTRSYKNKWQRLFVRNGGYQQTTSKKVNDYYQIKKPLNLTLVDSGTEIVTGSPVAFASISWLRPLGYYPEGYEVLIKRSTDADYSESKPIKIKDHELKFNLPIGVAHKVKVRAISNVGVGGDFSDELTINAIYDTIAPNIPSGLSLTGLNEKIEITIDPNTDQDLAGYRFYLLQDAAPTEKTISFVSTSNEQITTSTVHGYVTGDTVLVKGTAYNSVIPTGIIAFKIYTITVVDTTTFTLDTVDVTAAGSGTLKCMKVDGFKSTTSTNTTITELDAGNYHVVGSAFDFSGNESDISSSQNVEVDKQIIIRTQAEFTHWMNILTEVDPTTIDTTYDWNIVKIWKRKDGIQSDYTYSMTGETKYIRQRTLEIIGMDRPEITVTQTKTFGASGTLTNFNIDVDEFSFKNIIYNTVYNGDADTIKDFTLNFRSTISRVVWNVDNIEINTDSTALTPFASATLLAQGLVMFPFNTSENKLFTIENSLFSGQTRGVQFTSLLGYIKEKLRFNRNVFEGSPTVFNSMNLSTRLNDCEIQGNTFTNSILNLDAANDVEALDINTNTFIFDNDMGGANNYCILFDNNGNNRENISIQCNNVVYNDSTATGNYYFIYSGGNGLDNASLLNNRIFDRNTVGFFTDWIDNLGGAANGLYIQGNSPKKTADPTDKRP